MANGEEVVEPVLTLHASCLCSKWGFGDGDIIYDYLYEVIDAGYLDEHPYGLFDEHKALRALVRDLLIPVIPVPIEVYDIETIHNPIRASMIDGKPHDVYMDDTPGILEDICVEIPWRTMVRYCGLEVVVGEVIRKELT